MTRNDRRVRAQSFVFHDGDLVTASGRFVADNDGEWLDVGRGAIPLIFVPDASPRPRSTHSVRLVGAVGSGVPTDFGPDGSKPGQITVVGAWHHGTIDVQSQSPVRLHGRPTPRWSVPPCPAPPGGWPHGPALEKLTDQVEDLLKHESVVSVADFRPSSTQTVLVVASLDVPAVQRLLRPALPGRVCVTHSRWTRAQIADVRGHLRTAFRAWSIDSIGESATEAGQAVVVVTLMRVTQTVADWADSVPDGLVDLDPSITPFGARE